MVEKKAKKTLFCYCNVGGELVVGADKSVTYKGGRIDGIVIDQDTTFDALIGLICDQLRIPRTGYAFKYSVMFDRTCLLPLQDQSGFAKLLQFNDGVGYVYVEEAADAEHVPPVVAATRCSNTEQQSPAGDRYHVNRDFLAGCTSREEAALDADYADEVPSGHASSEGQPPSPSSSPSPIQVSPAPPSVMTEGWEQEIIGVGQEFPNLEAFRKALFKYSIAKSFRVLSNSKIKKHGYCTANCAVKACPWRLTVTSAKDKFNENARGTLILRTFIDEHKHSEQDILQPLVSSKLMAGLIEERRQSIPNITPKQFAKDIESKFPVTLNYMQSYQLRRLAEEAIHGKVEDAFKLIPWMCEHLMDVMPGTVATWASTEDNKFKQLFVAYHSSVHGFKDGCRPLLLVNYFEIVNPYEGTLLSVSALDANNETFPLAYGISSSKESVDWPWFFEKLKSLVGEGEIVIISDHYKSMRNVINEVFGAENHALSYQHLKGNFRTFVCEQFKLRGSGKETSACMLLDHIAYARLEADYDKALLTMRRYNREVYEWVLANSPEHWANFYFRKKRWDNFNSDPADIFESQLQNDSQVPVLEFMKAHQQKLKELLLSRQRDVATWKIPVGDKIEKKIRENIGKGQGLVMEQVSDSIFEFPSQRTHVVDLLIRSCSCLEWQMTGIPCQHACSVLQRKNLDIYSFVDKCYQKATQESIYAELMPNLDLNNMPKPDQIAGLGSDKSPCLGPPSKRKRGRPKQNLVQTPQTNKGSTSCSLCKQSGHNKKTCKNVR